MKTHTQLRPAYIREEVRKYFINTPFGRMEQDCFAPWWLETQEGLTHDYARRSSSDGSHDFGIDAFMIDPKKPELVLIQAKLSDSREEIRKAVQEFGKESVAKLAQLLGVQGAELSPQENSVIKVLRMALNDIPAENRNQLQVKFYVLHLCEQDAKLIRDSIKDDIKNLEDQFTENLPGFKPPIIEFIEYDEGSITISQLQTIEFYGTIEECEIWSNSEGIKSVKIAFGTTRLEDLVRLYQVFHNDLFEKNVRYFITSSKNRKEGGAVGNIKETLRNICILKKLPPGIFQIYHNGISVCCKNWSLNNGKISFETPSVVNGCQSIFAANDFYKKYKERIDKDPSNWHAIKIPIRIIETPNDDLIYDIAMNNNRQNAIRSSALRANDPIQRSLDIRFKDIGVFYERQDYEYKTLSSSEYDEDKEEMKAFSNTAQNEPINIEEIAQAIAAVAGEFEYAKSYSRIFESKEIYQDVFSEEHLASVRFLVGLRNVVNALADVLNYFKTEVAKYEGLASRYVKWHILYLLMRYVAKNEKDWFVKEICQATKKSGDVKDILIKLLKRSRILMVIKDLYIDSDNNWREVSESKELLQKATKKLNLDRVNPFEGWPK